MTYLFTVEDMFQLDKRGLVLAYGIPHSSTTTVTKGDSLLLRKPDQTTLDTHLLDIPMIRYRPDVKAEDKATPIMIGKGITKEDIPLGTEVFLLSNQSNETKTLNLRVINLSEPEGTLQSNVKKIEAIISTMKDVTTNKPIEAHAKGGYNISISVNSTSIEPIIEALSEDGYKPVI